jgi:hypothetical protein
MAKEKDTKPEGGFRDHQCGSAEPETIEPKSEAKAEAGDK